MAIENSRPQRNVRSTGGLPHCALWLPYAPAHDARLLPALIISGLWLALVVSLSWSAESMVMQVQGPGSGDLLLQVSPFVQTSQCCCRITKALRS